MRLVNSITASSLFRSSQNEVPVNPRWPTVSGEKWRPALESEGAGVSKPNAQELEGSIRAGRRNWTSSSRDQGVEVFIEPSVSKIVSRTHFTSEAVPKRPECPATSERLAAGRSKSEMIEEEFYR